MKGGKERGNRRWAETGRKRGGDELLSWDFSEEEWESMWRKGEKDRKE